jgi:hypothetical protein
MRAQGLLAQLTGKLTSFPAELSPVITEAEVKRSTMLIITAFLNPGVFPSPTHFAAD